MLLIIFLKSFYFSTKQVVFSLNKGKIGSLLLTNIAILKTQIYWSRDRYLH